MGIATTPFDQARADINDLLTIPIRRWMAIPPTARRDDTFIRLFSVPLDLAAAGFHVTVKQTDRGWYVEASRRLTSTAKLHVVGQARSYLSTLYQLADSAADAIDQLEREARVAAIAAEKREVAA